MRGVVTYLLTGIVALLAGMPASPTYQLHNYSFGSGGTASSSSTTYGVNGTTGQQSSLQVNGTTYNAQPGNNYSQNANVPTITIANGNNYYNKLLVTIGTQNNPSDALYAVAISTDGFSSTTNYVKSDSTVGTTLVYPTDYRTYAGWGSGSGVFVIGLSPSTTYTVKAKAIQGKYTESSYGPTSAVATVTPQLSFSVSPATVDLGTLSAGSVATASPNGSITFATNAESGGNVYLASQNAGLKSSLVAPTIASATADLSSGSVTQGYGAQGSGATQTSGGAFTTVSPFNSSANNVGGLTTGFQPIFTTPGPVFGGSAAVVIKAKSSVITPAAPDYADILTLIAAAAF